MKQAIRRKAVSLFLAGSLAFLTTACGSAAGVQTATQSAAAGQDGSTMLVVYFSVTENTDVDAVASASIMPGTGRGVVATLADDIAAATGAAEYSILTSTDYPGDIGAVIEQAATEQEDNFRPELTSHIENLDQYDTIFIGYPNWWADLPMVYYSFFAEYDFAGKTIVPFCVHNGSRFSRTIDTIAQLEPQAHVVTDGFTISISDVSAATAADINAWLTELGYPVKN